MIENFIKINKLINIIKLKYERLHAIASHAISCLNVVHFKIVKLFNMFVVHLKKKNKLNLSS